MPASPLAGWTQLVLEGHKFLLASSRTTVSRWPAQGSAPAAVEVLSRVNLFGSLAREHRAVALSAANGPTSRWVDLVPGERLNAHILTPGGVEYWRYRRPNGAERTGSFENWGEPKRRTVPAPPAYQATCPGPVDAYTLLARLDCLAAGDSRSVAVATRDGIGMVRARRDAPRPQAFTLRDLDRGASTAVQLEVVRIVLGEPGAAAETVLGMQGEVTLLVDAGSGALLEIEGRDDDVPGTIRLRLTGFSRRALSRPAMPWPTAAQTAAR
ncbi:MAG: hypothetical protein KBD01_17665 [Acidobacteria bacterium]|nr:hypothetical protein [Acidobacteriota bacterium]